jgi:hypothetical protein
MPARFERIRQAYAQSSPGSIGDHVGFARTQTRVIRPLDEVEYALYLALSLVKHTQSKPASTSGPPQSIAAALAVRLAERAGGGGRAAYAILPSSVTQSVICS